MGMESRYTWLDGKLISTENASFPFLTSGLHYGFGVFEGIRCYETARGPAVFRLPEHARRLCNSARLLGLEMTYDAEQIASACLETVGANEFRECYLRPLAFTTSSGWNLSVKGVPVSLGVAAWKWNAYLGEEAVEKGVRANVSSYTRHHSNVTLTKAKVCGNYVNSALAKTESVRLGFDEAIMLDPAGFVAECTGQNIFLVREGRLISPPSATILEGITRDSVITMARDLGYAVEEQLVSRDQLYLADEVFVCGTASEVIALREIDARPIGNGGTGPITRILQNAYSSAVRGEAQRYEKWLTYVPARSRQAA